MLVLEAAVLDLVDESKEEDTRPTWSLGELGIASEVPSIFFLSAIQRD